MPDVNPVQDALNEALTVEDAESQSASKSESEVTQALNDALENEDGKEAAASEDKTSKSTEKSGEKEPKTVPYDRLSKVVAQKNEVSEKLKAVEDQFKKAGEREEALRGKVAELETDHQILDAIKALSNDPKYKDHVVAIDRALQGLDEEIETAEKTGDKEGASDAEKRFEAKYKELENLVADQNAEKLWDETNRLASDMLNALPEEYTDEDKETLSQLWTSRVDWAGIEKDGRDSIPKALQASLAETIRQYGKPRGALVAETTKEIESRIPEAKLVSPEDTVKGLLEKNWAETNEEGKVVHSDEAFADGMAELLRKTSGR
jgi:hypothetical protein